MKKILKRALAAVTSAVLCAGMATAYAQPSEEAFAVNGDTAAAPAPLQSMVYLQNGMRAVVITPGVDFAEDSGVTSEELDMELAELFAKILSYKMNAVIINSSCDGEPFYSSEANSGDILLSVCEAARSAGLYTYIDLDVGLLLEQVIEEGGGLKSGFSAAAHRFAMKYPCSGIILSDYYTPDTPEMYAEYMSCGSGIGYTNWLYETNEYICRTMSEVIRGTDNTTAVGMLISDMWANYTSEESGSVTADSTEALYDGFCDTKKYIEKGYADFAMVKAYGSTSDGALNFENVVSWWYDLAESSGTRLYVLHLNDRIGQYSGWYEDQLLRQLAEIGRAHV